MRKICARLALFNEGLAYIGLGDIGLGNKLAEQAIAAVQAGDNPEAAKDLLREYASALERAGFATRANQVHHRYDELSEKILAETRRRAVTELSVKFEQERRARD